MDFKHRLPPHRRNQFTVCLLRAAFAYLFAFIPIGSKYKSLSRKMNHILVSSIFSIFFGQRAHRRQRLKAGIEIMKSMSVTDLRLHFSGNPAFSTLDIRMTEYGVWEVRHPHAH